MDEFLINLLTLSLGGGVVGAVLMGLARLTRSRYGARWRCVVWALLCLRMIWPLPLFPAVPSARCPDVDGGSAREAWRTPAFHLPANPEAAATQGRTPPTTWGPTAPDIPTVWEHVLDSAVWPALRTVRGRPPGLPPQPNAEDSGTDAGVPRCSTPEPLLRPGPTPW